MSRAPRSSTSTSPIRFANPHGHVFDRWGQDIVVDGTGAVPYHAPLFSSRLDFPQKHNRPPQVYRQRTRPCPGIEILSSRHFPDEMQGNLLVANVIGFQGILRYKLFDKDSSLARPGAGADPLLDRSELPPVRHRDRARRGDLLHRLAQPDHRPHAAQPARSRAATAMHGRVYRVTYEGRPLEKPAQDRRRADRQAAGPAEGSG